MKILDSSAWLEYFAGSKNADIVEKYVHSPETLIVPSLTIFEVKKKILKQFTLAEADLAITYMKRSELKGMSYEIASIAAEISFEKRLPMADSIIYATGMLNGAQIITFDYDFIELDNVIVLNKI
jgi:toxin FitB